MLVICPTKGRPKNALRLSQHFYDTRVGDTDLTFCIDNDDETAHEYMETVLYYSKGPAKRLGPWLNEKAREQGHNYDIIGFLGDDVIPRTDGWDDLVRDAMQPNGIVYCNDGWQGEGLPTGVFMDAKMIDKAGYMVYPELVHLYIDNHWKAWGEALGTLTYLPNVHLEHMHPFAGKAETDDVYEAANAPDMYTKDGQAFMKFIEWELGPLTERVLNG